MEGKPEYTKILKALMELPFQVGRGLLVDFLTGDYSNKSISKNKLDELYNFDSLAWDKSRINGEIDRLISNGMIEMVTSDYNRFVKVMSLTIKGRNEIVRPTLEDKRLGNRVNFGESEVNEDDRVMFEKYGDFLSMYNDEQKKAIISNSRRLLCVAGAGTGKTTVLTKRVEFLVRHRGVDPKKILAVTFTRKARLEMKKRLDDLGVFGVRVHTFNSFCERILQENGRDIYGRTVRVLGYGDKVLAMNMAIASLGLDMDSVVDEYFSASQKKFKTRSQLVNSFMADCFSVMDYIKMTGRSGLGSRGLEAKDWIRSVDVNERNNAERIFRIVKYLKEHMDTQGLRDYTDQIIDCVDFFRTNPDKVPAFEHVLVDEYQDVNALQIELIELLKPKNLFVVGDPRQSIFGWRGSDVSFILDFGKRQGESSLKGESSLRDGGDLDRDGVEVVHLKKNYRSLPGVVEFMNHSIREMKLPDLEAALQSEDKERGVRKKARIEIMEFANEDVEREFVLGKLEEASKGEEIFVLARTNKSLMELSNVLNARGIVHMIRSDESAGRSQGVRNKEGFVGITLATIHAIKGLEAKRVFVIGASEQNFPCKATDHPVVDMVKKEDYDREEEERRLFYVAVSRAREELIITHSKKATYYITDAMRVLARDKEKGVGGKAEEEELDEGLVGELKSWRSVVAAERGVAAFVILSNATLEEIARKMPRNADELLRIGGIGPEKLLKYGERILEIVSVFDGDGEEELGIF